MSVAFNTAVIDTGVLFTALTLNYIERANLPEPKRSRILESAVDDRELLINENRQQAYLLLVTSIRTPLITSHVVGELQGLQNSCLKLKGQDLRFFWIHTLDFLASHNFDERLRRLLDIGHLEEMRELICAVGPADTGLIDLALSVPCPLVTDDERTLAWRAREAGIVCHVARHLV